MVKKQLPIPEAALRDGNSVEMLRVWIAEKKLHCSIKVGMYQERESFEKELEAPTSKADGEFIVRH